MSPGPGSWLSSSHFEPSSEKTKIFVVQLSGVIKVLSVEESIPSVSVYEEYTQNVE